jgi:hypothetical protein
MQSVPMIAVRDVRATVGWYRRLLACQAEPVSEDFGRVRAGDRVLLLVHDRNGQEHGAWEPVAPERPADGFLLWILTEDLDAIHERARGMGAEILVAPHVNAEDGAREFTLRDLDGCALAISEGPG